MARGMAYFCSQNIDDVDLHADESSLYEYLDELNVDYVKNEPEDSAKDLSDGFLTMLKSMGAKTGTDTDMDGRAVAYFIISDNVRRAWFRGKYERLQKAVTALSLDDFIKEKAAALSDLIEDEYGDCVVGIYPGSSYPYPVDEFIREAETGKKYYLSESVVLMH